MSLSANSIVEDALAFHRKGQLSKASELYVKALLLQPKHPTALHLLGVIRHQEGNNLESEKLIKQALKITPEDIMAMSNLATTYQTLGKLEKAQTLFTKIISKQPNNPQIYVNRGNAYRASKQNTKASKDYKIALQLNPGLFEAARNLGLCLQEEGHFDEARQALEYCVKLAPQYAQGRLSLANLYYEMGEMLAAKSEYMSTLKLAPHIPALHCDLAITLRNLGELDLARKHFEKTVNLEPKLGRAWRGLAGLKTYNDSSDLISMQEALLIVTDDTSKMHIEFALGKAQEDLENYETAFNHFQLANTIHETSFTYNVKSDLDFFESLETTINPAFINRYSGSGVQSTRPIFVIGMPRSGTSLVEQILASHSNVFGAGELDSLSTAINSVFPMIDGQDYGQGLGNSTLEGFERIANSYLNELSRKFKTKTAYIVDKMPMNFIHVGVISLAFPNAQIIHCRRNPLDNCLSVYKNFLPADGHRYAVNLESLGQYYNGYIKLMDHWENQFPEKILNIDYDKLVQAPEETTRKMLTACGLPFEEACLSPHKTNRVVSTLSAVQVRQPIHIKSVGSSLKYSEQLSPLLEILNQN